MQASTDRLQFAPPPPPGMLRALGFAIIAHLLLMLALGWGVNWKRDPVTISAEAELWSALPQQAAPKLVEPPPPPPAPEPAPVIAPPAAVVAPPPKPEPAPREADIALQREQDRQKERDKQAEARRKQLALEREQQREADKELAAKKKAAADRKLDAQRELEERRKQEQAKAKAAEDRQRQEAARRQQADEKRIEAQRQANLDRMKGLAGATGSPAATGTALRSSGTSASYAGRVAARVKPNIVFSEEISGNPRAEIEVRTSPDGTIVGQRVLKSSGVKAWDDAVLKAVIKTEVLPRDTDGRVPSPLIIDFRPRD
jgi:colicin import membrane protein